VNDRTLVTQLLSGEPAKVALVGKPVFRLNAMLVERLVDGSFPTPAPQVTQYDHIDQFIDTEAGVSPKCALCLHLSSDAENPETVLGVACRASPGLVVVEHSSSSPATALYGDEQFFAFGFRRIGQSSEVSELQQRWYVYSLRDYKRSPDWLNARFWAHPERFDLQD